MSDIAELGLKIDANGVLTATGALDKMTAAGGRAQGAFDKLKGAAAQLGVAFSAGMIFRAVLRETIEAQNAMAQLEAAVLATGGAAGRSVAQLDALAKSLQRTTVYSDEAVMGAEAVILTFTKIRGVNLDRAVRDVTDLAARMGGDLPGAALQLGKALQEPTTGLTMLRRAGLTFDDAQVKVIKHLAETGRLAEAQALILTELESRFRGSAAAARDTLGGALAGLKNAFGDLLEVSRGGSGGIVDALNALAAALAKNATAIRDTAVALGVLAGAFGVARVAAWSFALVGPEIAGVRMAIRTFRNDMAVAAIVGKEGFTGMAQASAYFRGTMMSLGPILGGLVTYLGPLVALGLTLKLIVDAIKNVRLDEEEIAGADLMSRYNEARAWVRMHGGGRAGLASAREHGFTDVYGTGGAGRTDGTSAAAAEDAVRAEADRLKKVAEDFNRDEYEAWRRLQEGRRDLAIQINQEIIDAQRAESEAWVDEALRSLQKVSDEEKQMLRKLDPYRKTQDKTGTGGGTDWSRALPTVGGIDLGALLSSPKSFGMDLVAKAIEDFLSFSKDSEEATRALTTALRENARAIAGLAAGFGLKWREGVTDWMGRTVVQRGWEAAAPGADAELAALSAAIFDLKLKAQSLYRDVAMLNGELARLNALELAAAEVIRATWARKQTEMQQDYAVRALRAVGLEAEADAMAFAQAQQREMAQAIRDGADAATRAALAETQRQEAIRRTAEVAIAAARKEADAAASRLASAQGALDATRATLSGLQAYSASLRGLTGSPASNLASSRAAFEALAVKARAGDQTAIAGLEGAGTTYLEQSRAYNASGMGYQRDVASVQKVVDEVAATYQATATAQESMVALLTEQNRIAAASLKALEDAEFVRQHEAAEAYYANAYTTAQAANDTAGMLAALDALRLLGLAQIDRATTDLLALQNSLDVATQRQAAQTIAALQTQRDAITAAFDATAVAIVAGFPVTDVSALYSNAMAQMHQADLIGALAAQAALIGTGNAALLFALGLIQTAISTEKVDGAELYSIIPPVTRADLSSTATNTAAVVARVETQTAVLVAGFEALSGELASLKLEMAKLAAATRKTGEELAVRL